MNILYDEGNKKTEFAVKSLLPFYIDKIRNTNDLDEKEELETNVASLKIFPYRISDEVRLGSLRDDGSHWYYLEQNNKTRLIQSKHYRIIADNLIDKDTFQAFRELFGGDGAGYIEQYNNNAVISSLIEDMAQETFYSDTWWNGALNLYKLWDKTNPGDRYKSASNNISSDYILLYDESYCDEKHRKQLFKYHVFEDLEETRGYKQYISNIGNGQQEEGLQFLEYLGVKCRISRKENDIIQIDSCVINFFQKVHREVHFPVGEKDGRAFELAELSSYIFSTLLVRNYIGQNHTLSGFVNSIDGQGIAVLNVNEEYVELSNDLFYVERGYRDKVNEIIHTIPNQKKLNSLIINLNSDVSYLLGNAFSHIHNLAEIDDYEAYDFGEYKINEIDFYKWAWNFQDIINTKDNLICCILNYFTKKGRVGPDQASFVLDVLENPFDDIELEVYSFEIHASTEVLFNNATFIDNLIDDRYGYNYQFSFIPENPRQVDTVTIKKHICQRLTDMQNDGIITGSKCDEIRNADFWNYVYSGPVGSEIIDNNYSNDSEEKLYVVIACGKDEERQEKGLLVHATDEEDAIISIGQFIRDRYYIDIPNLATNWKESYKDIVDGISSFINQKYACHSENELINATPNMADVINFGEEKKIWNNLKNMHNSLLADKQSHVDFGKPFLMEKYKGRCQLCGNRTAMSAQNAYAFTFRMVKKHENPVMADIASNMFCLCPSCHGALQYGNFMGKDLSEISRKAREYVSLYQESVEENVDEDDKSVISEFADDAKKGKEGFKSPIICKVTVNGQQQDMAFSWEHFIWIAFTLNEKESLH